MRRVPPYFSLPFQPIYEVKPGSSLNITCMAGGSPMPYVKWRKGLEDLEPEHSLPIGRNILVLEDIQESANYTCVASSKLGQVENTTFVRVEGNAPPYPASPTSPLPPFPRPLIRPTSR